MAKKFPIHPAHPERICWGCDKYCSVDSMRCGNGSDRAQHPVELFGSDWLEFGNEETAPSNSSKQNHPLLPAENKPLVASSAQDSDNQVTATSPDES